MNATIIASIIFFTLGIIIGKKTSKNDMFEYLFECSMDILEECRKKGYFDDEEVSPTLMKYNVFGHKVKEFIFKCQALKHNGHLD